jgi:hypothetical protein
MSIVPQRIDQTGRDSEAHAEADISRPRTDPRVLDVVTVNQTTAVEPDSFDKDQLQRAPSRDVVALLGASSRARRSSDDDGQGVTSGQT